ncbi:hypothetical protein BB8028_0001g05960 [Beauveria bassiana]|uniref:Uncharacterized protein n=1 Tax=Beauveria bassiana TaxID=176275 RepID=A0A2S7XY06_BEABA|nr:hypothetical protein BB8028_0001g05960 [Beauveria bassiana]
MNCTDIANIGKDVATLYLRILASHDERHSRLYVELLNDGPDASSERSQLETRIDKESES